MRADESTLVSRALERQFRIAVKLSPGKATSVKPPFADSKAQNKEKLASQWAREAGHYLDSQRQCVSCGLLCVDLGKNIAYLEACLAFPCLGLANSGAVFKLRNFNKEVGETYLFHGLHVHSSHAVATHFNLKASNAAIMGSMTISTSMPSVTITAVGHYDNYSYYSKDSIGLL